MKSNGIQKIATYVLIGLFMLWGITRIITGYLSNTNQWTTEDKEQLKKMCINDVGGRAVRFAQETEEYCSCFSESITNGFSKVEYQYIKAQGEKDQNEEFMPVILDCYNEYQKAMFDKTSLD